MVRQACPMLVESLVLLVGLAVLHSCVFVVPGVCQVQLVG